MAEKRMFAKSIVLSDAFLDMPLSARCLYFTLGMLADDEGFVGSPKAIMRQCGASMDDMNVLISKRYVLVFDSGVIVIKHWRINNFLRNDRTHETTYLEEKSTLMLDEKGAYTEANLEFGIPTDNQAATTCQPTDSERYTENRLDKNRLDKNKNNRAVFVKPTVDEVSAYCKERNNGIDANDFVDFYESKGWMIGKNKMKDWKAAVRTWERSRKNKPADKQATKFSNFEERKQNFEDLDSWAWSN